MTPLPRRIGKFEILERLGEGAMGEVSLARDTVLGREVALKTIHPAALNIPDARARFFREAQASGRLGHPNLVSVHEFGEDQGILYIAMEFVPGDDLAGLLRTRSLPAREVLEVLAQVCDGLAYAHQHEVLHRDIKPSNIRVTRISGRPLAKVLDFGIARMAGSELTSSGTLMGTFGYMAPEYIQTGKATPQADLFAVGVILYEALAGFRPFGGESTATVLHRIIHEEPPPLDPAGLQGISPAIREVAVRALSKDPALRYPGAEALAAVLRAAQDPAWTPAAEGDATVRSARTTLDLPPPPRRTRKGRPGALAALALLAALGAGGWAWRRHHRAIPHPAPPAPALTPALTSAPAPAPPQPTVPAPAPEPAPSTPPVRDQEPAAPRPSPSRAPKAEPARPVPEPGRPAFADLNAAAAALETDPGAVAAYLDRLLREDPSNDRAVALRIVARYDAGDYEGCARAMGEAKASGHLIRVMAVKYPRLRRMLEEERAARHLPRLRGAAGD